MGQEVYKDYLGFNRSIKLSEVGLYEGRDFVLEEKYNGWWCCVKFETTLTVTTTTCISRSGNVLEEAGKELAKSFAGFDGVMVGEWMPNEKKLWAFDLLEYRGQGIRFTPLIERRWQLEDVMRKMKATNVTLVPQYSKGFAAVAKAIIADGGEGVALKHEASMYHSNLASRKTGMWIKAKPKHGDEDAKRNNDYPYLITSSGAVPYSS